MDQVQTDPPGQSSGPWARRMPWGAATWGVQVDFREERYMGHGSERRG